MYIVLYTTSMNVSRMRRVTNESSLDRALVGDDCFYSLLHLECHSISFSILDRIGLFSTERGNGGLQN